MTPREQELRQTCPQYPWREYDAPGKWKDPSKKELILLLLKNSTMLATEYYLGSDKWNDEEFGLLCKALVFNKRVKKLGLDKNKEMTSDATVASLTTLLDHNSTITELDLGQINFNEKGIEDLKKLVEKHTSIVKLT